jgi:hypothetical protein
MKSLARTRRLPSHTADGAVVLGNPVPIGIPALLLADQLSRGRTEEQILSGKRGLIAEYAAARAHGQPRRFGFREGLP